MKPKQGVSRRTVVKGTAWAVPAVVVASAAPAMAASPCVTISFGPNSCKQPGEGQNIKGYNLQFCFTNTCNTAITVTVTAIQGNQGNAPLQPVTPPLVITVPANTANFCSTQLVQYCSNNSGNFLNVTFHIGNGADQIQQVPSPVNAANCSGGTLCA
jgi:hypothetical protein